MYSIDGLCPSGHPMGGYGFNIHLSPAFRDAVMKSELDQEKVDHVIKIYGQEWLQKCGFSHYYDPENCTYDNEGQSIPSKQTRPGYSPRDIRVSWGEWGIEHLYVPGNACGLDLDRNSCGCVYKDGEVLLPHNVDSWGQVCLLLIVFTWFAHTVTLFDTVNNE